MSGEKHISERLVDELRAAGVTVVEVGGMPNLIISFDRVVDPDVEAIFAAAMCRYIALPEWKAEGMPAFYETQIWKRVRYKALVKYGNRCQCCGSGPQTGAVLHVDHIKPRSKYPQLAFSIGNLQVLCADCNIGKSNKDETDWRL